MHTGGKTPEKLLRHGMISREVLLGVIRIYITALKKGPRGRVADTLHNSWIHM